MAHIRTSYKQIWVAVGATALGPNMSLCVHVMSCNFYTYTLIINIFFHLLPVNIKDNIKDNNFFISLLKKLEASKHVALFTGPFLTIWGPKAKPNTEALSTHVYI